MRRQQVKDSQEHLHLNDTITHVKCDDPGENPHALSDVAAGGISLNY
jgi:hypothetical protein